MSLPNSAQEQLRQYVEQIERLEEEKRQTGEDIKDKFLELKANGFDPKIVKEVLKLRKVSSIEREEHDMVLDTYLHALGMANETD
jgi:uncharacterized protein (UPF0335 family)